MFLFYFFAAVAIWLGFVSLRGGFRFAAYVKEDRCAAAGDYHPFVSVILPFRGVDNRFEENLRSLLEQNYAAYEVLFVTDDASDAGVEVVHRVMSNKPSAKLVIAGTATDSGQKVHNLRCAVSQVDTRSSVLVFADSDGRPHQHWLRRLVAPLADQSLGATTAYRWFTCEGVSFAARLRAVWNSSITSALGANTEKNFCWGGSTAVRREIFEALGVLEAWHGSVSDDFTLTRLMQKASRPIKFVPQCLVLSADDCSIRELLEFTTRQLKITRVYAPRLWRASLTGSVIFVAVFFGSLLLLSVVQHRQDAIILVITIISMFLLGAVKSAIRLRAVQFAIADYANHPRPGWLSHLLLWPLASVLFLYNGLAAAFSRRINWRGISYELKSPHEAVIIRPKGESHV